MRRRLRTSAALEPCAAISCVSCDEHADDLRLPGGIRVAGFLRDENPEAVASRERRVRELIPKLKASILRSRSRRGESPPPSRGFRLEGQQLAGRWQRRAENPADEHHVAAVAETPLAG